MSIKTWKVKEDSTTGIQIGEAFIQIVVSAGSEGSPGSNRDVAPSGVGFHITEKAVHIQGPVHFLDGPDKNTYGALWRPQSGWRQMFPSSIAYPNPNLIMDPQLVVFIEHMAKSVQWMATAMV